MKIATWNINSVRARTGRLLAWLKSHQPDVLCLQETKVADDEFPTAELSELGYRTAVRGQKSYNGVAIISRAELSDVASAFDDGGPDEQARFLSARTGELRIVTVYVPNGQEPGSAAYLFKLEWMKRLRRYLDARHRADERLLLCGDFNVAPEDRDVWDPPRWHESIMCTTGERNALAEIVGFGLKDAFRRLHSEGGHYTWWDYRLRAFEKDRGLRIDHVYVTEPVVPGISAAAIDRDERRGKLPSDHAPVIVMLD
jgi:exodeoxyribonuclease-3